MDNYDFAVVCGIPHGVEISGTDQSELDALTKQMAQFFPRMRIDSTSKLPSGEVYSYFVGGLSGRELDTAWWLVKQLCTRGWEPLGEGSVVAGGNSGIVTYLRYQFRRKCR